MFESYELKIDMSNISITVKHEHNNFCSCVSRSPRVMRKYTCVS